MSIELVLDGGLRGAHLTLAVGIGEKLGVAGVANGEQGDVLHALDNTEIALGHEASLHKSHP
jgi:hypothetical protein